MISDGQTMKSSCFCKLVWNTKLKKNIKDSAGKVNKYENICEIVVENYPTDEADKEKYPNGEKMGKVLTKDPISVKLKIIRADFRKAIDKGKRGGGGRVVFTFFNMRKQLWGGSPAVTAIENSIDSPEVHLEESFSPSTSDATNRNDTSIDMPMLTHQENDETDEENDSEELLLTANDITNSRERANEFLKNRLHSPLV